MKIFDSLIIFSIFTACIASYSFNIPPKMGLPGVCLFHGMRLQPGENQMLHKCQNVHCMEDGSMKIEGCDQKPCHSMDPTIVTHSMNQLPYPECCKICMTDYHGIPNSMGRFMYQYHQQPYPFMTSQQYQYYNNYAGHNMELY